MWRSYFTDKKWSLWCYGGGFAFSSNCFSNLVIDVQFNNWYGSFYDLLQKPPETGGLSEFYERLTFLFI